MKVISFCRYNRCQKTFFVVYKKKKIIKEPNLTLYKYDNETKKIPFKNLKITNPNFVIIVSIYINNELFMLHIYFHYNLVNFHILKLYIRVFIITIPNKI